MSLEEDLLKIERSFWTGGPEAYEQHADQSCLVVFQQMAGVMANAEIAKTAQAGRWDDIVINPKGAVELSDDSAVIAYECSAKRKDGEPYHALVSSGYVRRADGWKLAFHQQTPMD